MATGIALLLLGLAAGADAHDLGCSHPDNWAATSALVKLKNAGVTDNPLVDFDETRVELLAQQKIGDDLYRQVHHVTFALKGGGTIDAITSNNASSEECSMSSVEVFLVSKHLVNSP